MRKTFKTVVALMLVVFLALTMTAVAFAANIGTNGVVETDETSVVIPKGIILKNETSGDYYSPTVTFTYSLAPETPTTGAQSGGLPVEVGPAGGAKLANTNVVFTSALVTGIDASGKEITEDITVDVDLSKFTKPGVYRYKITDTTEKSVLYNAGIVRPDDYKTNLYLDVYVKWNGASTPALTVYGYALADDNYTDASGHKNSGFNGGGVGTSADVYTTYNVRIEKKVEGSMGDKSHEFPFAITVDNGGLQYASGEGTASTWGTAASLDANLKNGDVFYINGLSPRATVSVSETNDTSDTYKVKVEGKATSSYETLVAEADVASGTTADLAAGAVSTYATVNSATSVNTDGAKTKYSDIVFTNSLSDVSPTGLVLRFAPFILMLGFAAVLIVLVRRNRTRKAQTRAI